METQNKFRISEKHIRKTIVFLILFLLAGVLFSVVVSSFYRNHLRSNATKLQPFKASGEYGEYLEKYKDKPVVKDKTTTVWGKDAHVTGEHTIKPSEINPSLGSLLYSGTSGNAYWDNVDVEEEGFYNLIFHYIPEPHGGNNIERQIKVNGEVPFSDLNNVVFHRIWGDLGEKQVDKNKNEIKPRQIEYPRLHKMYVKDISGFIPEPYLVYFKKGINTLELSTVRETMSLYKIEIVPKRNIPSYDEYKTKNEELGYTKVDKTLYATDLKVKSNSPRIEGENSTLRSSSVIYAISDRTSAYTSPSDPVRLLLNTIGGDNWKTPNDWIEWDINVPKAGLYKVTLRSRQVTNRGMFSTRAFYINGEVPFKEALNTKYRYGSDWSMVTLGSDKEDYLFYFKEGENKIRLEASLGDYGYQIARVQKTVDDLNLMYREIITRIGINPDKYIDYQLERNIPNLLPTLKKSAETLRSITSELDKISGERSPETATLYTVAAQLDKLVKKPRNIQKSLTAFSQNISSLGTFISKVSLQTLTIDYLMVTAPDYKIPRANPIFFVSFWFKTRSFFKSFFFDYESIGTPEIQKGQKTIEVWLLTDALVGRDQANAIRSLIDTTFKEKYNVNLKIVGPEVLLTATLAGRGPDVAINAFNGTPINYALRGAVYDISVFDDFEEVKSRFTQSAMDPYYLEDFEPNYKPDGTQVLKADGTPKTDGYYALPNRQAWLMMFYRTDIFKEKDFKVPNTWEEVVSLVPELQIKNLKFYLPLNTVGASSIINQIFASYLFQNSQNVQEALYKRTPTADGKYYLTSNIGSEEGMKAFEFWSDFYTNYSFSLSISDATFINMFRSGEMPIGIASYGTYNTLTVSAPEIKGRWKFAMIPGVEKIDSDGNKYIDRKTPSMGTSVMMMKDVIKRKTYDGAWAFMKWWTMKDTQVAFAKEIEAILGPAGRHPTPNIEAFNQLPWTIEELKYLTDQRNQTVGIYEVPGGYYTGRNIENAFRKTVNTKKNPREILEEYVALIDKEIIRKRKEFGFPIPKN